MNKHIVQLIRERFHPLVRFCGPQSAGEVEVEGVRGTVYLGELSIWLWPAKSPHNGVLSDEQLGDVVSPHLLVRNLPHRLFKSSFPRKLGNAPRKTMLKQTRHARPDRLSFCHARSVCSRAGAAAPASDPGWQRPVWQSPRLAPEQEFQRSTRPPYSCSNRLESSCQQYTTYVNSQS
jgi:hypothetical protein